MHRVRLFTPRRLVLSHGLGRTHQGGVDLATQSASESRPHVAKPSPPGPDSPSTRLSTRSRPAIACTPCGKIYSPLMCSPKPMAQHQSSWDEKSQAEVKYTDYTVRIQSVAPAHYSHYSHTVTQSHSHTVTLSHCHTVTLSHCHTVTQSHSHTVTQSQIKDPPPTSSTNL